MNTTGARQEPEGAPDAPAPEFSVVIVSYNRADLLPAAIEHVLRQDHPATPTFELIVVDNNSSDATPAVVERACARDWRVRYVREPKQGVSHARNAGVAAARAPVVAYTDDDVRVGPGWLAAMARTFREFPGVSAVGGKVLPVWPSAPPDWLTQSHWGPLALVDHGERPVRVDAQNQLCLIGANLAVLRSAFTQVGAFSTHVQGVKGTVGSCEDHEFLLRLFAAGAFGIYDPRIVIHAAVQPERLDRAYHRRWHDSQGYFNAMMRPDYLERSSVGRLVDVPAHMYRAAVGDAFGWLRAALRRDDAVAWSRELRLRFFSAFLRTRLRQFRSLSLEERRLQWRHLARGLMGRLAELPHRAASAGRRS